MSEPINVPRLKYITVSERAISNDLTVSFTVLTPSPFQYEYFPPVIVIVEGVGVSSGSSGMSSSSAASRVRQKNLAVSRSVDKILPLLSGPESISTIVLCIAHRRGAASAGEQNSMKIKREVKNFLLIKFTP